MKNIVEDAIDVARSKIRSRIVVIPAGVGSQVDSPSTINRIIEAAVEPVLKGQHINGTGRFGSTGKTWGMHMTMGAGQHDNSWIESSRGYWATSNKYFFLMPKFDEQFVDGGFLKSFCQFYGVREVKNYRPRDVKNSFAEATFEDYLNKIMLEEI